MKGTQDNTTLKPLRAQWCSSIILLLSHSNFHCLLKERKRIKCSAFIWSKGHTVSEGPLCWPCLMKQLRYHVNGIARAEGDKSSLCSGLDVCVGMGNLWLALASNSWFSLWILQEETPPGKDVFHLCDFLLLLAALQMIWNRWAYQ